VGAPSLDESGTEKLGGRPDLQPRAVIVTNPMRGSG